MLSNYNRPIVRVTAVLQILEPYRETSN